MRALALFSGGLDSLLSVALVKAQGIEVSALHFDIGFEAKSFKKEELARRAEQLGVDFLHIDIREQFFKEVLFKPVYGYGKHFNPCIDCHANMFRQAHLLMKELGGSFLISGEVLGQRPKSQRAEALSQVEKLSGAKGLVLRPLSAKLLPPTIPEIEGWIDREKLYGISGRGRHEQLSLAASLGLEDLPSPAGGCLLTDESVSDKIRDINSLGELEVDEIPFVRSGRYFVLDDGARLIVGRNLDDNAALKEAKSERFAPIVQKGVIGPYSWLSKDASPNDLNVAMKIVLTYSKQTELGSTYEVEFMDGTYGASPFGSKDEAREWLL